MFEETPSWRDNLLTVKEAADLGWTNLYSGVAGTHHTSTSSMHLGQVVEGQDVPSLWGQVEEFKSLLVVTLHANAIWGTRVRTKNVIMWRRAKTEDS